MWKGGDISTSEWGGCGDVCFFSLLSGKLSWVKLCFSMRPVGWIFESVPAWSQTASWASCWDYGTSHECFRSALRLQCTFLKPRVGFRGGPKEESVRGRDPCLVPGRSDDVVAAFRAPPVSLPLRFSCPGSSSSRGCGKAAASARHWLGARRGRAASLRRGAPSRAVLSRAEPGGRWEPAGRAASPGPALFACPGAASGGRRGREEESRLGPEVLLPPPAAGQGCGLRGAQGSRSAVRRFRGRRCRVWSPSWVSPEAGRDKGGRLEPARRAESRRQVGPGPGWLRGASRRGVRNVPEETGGRGPGCVRFCASVVFHLAAKANTAFFLFQRRALWDYLTGFFCMDLSSE